MYDDIFQSALGCYNYQMSSTIKALLLALVAILAIKHLNPTASPEDLLLTPPPSRASSSRLLAQTLPNQPVYFDRLQYGNWSSQYPPFSFFWSNVGEAQYRFVYSTSQAYMNELSSVRVLLLDPEYMDKKLALLVLPVENSYQNQTKCWQGETSQANLYLLEDFGLANEQENMRVGFLVNSTYIEIKTLPPAENNTEPPITNPISFDLAISYHPREYQVFAPWLLLIPNIILLIGMYFKGTMPPLKISVVTLLISLNFILFVALLELYSGVQNLGNPYGWFMITGTLTFMVSVKFTQGFEEPARRLVGMQGYIGFCTITLVYLWTFFVFYWQGWFQIVNSLILLPQIIHNAYQGIKPGFNMGYYTVILSNQLYMLYYRGIPHNTTGISPSFGICMGILLSILFQLLILALQDKFGSRFFIPKCLIPNHYDYYMEVDLTDLNKSITHPLMEDCPICLFPLSQEPGQGDVQKNDSRSVVTKKKLMKTPCNHVFHVVCLENWMEHKFQCPIDRSQLPPLM